MLGVLGGAFTLTTTCVETNELKPAALPLLMPEFAAGAPVTEPFVTVWPSMTANKEKKTAQGDKTGSFNDMRTFHYIFLSYKILPDYPRLTKVCFRALSHHHCKARCMMA